MSEKYPILMCDKDGKDGKGGTCDAAFMYKDGVRLSYTFPKAQLND